MSLFLKKLKPQRALYRFISTVKTPSMGESITEGTLTEWHKKIGDFIARDEQVATIETDKIDVQVNSPVAGKLVELFCKEGDTVAVGGNLFNVDDSVAGEAPESKPETKAPEPKAKAAEPTPAVESKPVSKPAPASTPEPKASKPAPKPEAKPSKEPKITQEIVKGSRTERAVKMSRMRLRIAERLKESQTIAASLTTFNEIDMTNLINLRKKYKDAVLDKHGIKLGFMGAFLKASSTALQEVPAVNARLEGDNLIYSDFVDVSVAVSTPKGLVTPVLRNCESSSIIDLEKQLAALGAKAKNNDITLEDMAGGTFTISNGGVFGSLYGTPIINRPQAAILGMHAVKDRAVVVDGQVVVRPMMYVALTYDHRIIDGREAVTFLVKIKEIIEDPTRLLLEV